MKKIIAIVFPLLVVGSVYAQQEQNTQRNGRKDNPQQTPPVRQNAATKANSQTGASQNNTGQNATGNNPNRNEDRAIGNKTDNLIQVDTARGAGARAPHDKTSAAVKDAATPDGATNNTNTPNSMNATPITPDASNSYNRTSNGGIGEDLEQKSGTFHYMDKLNTDIPSSKGGVKPGDGANATSSPTQGDASTGASMSTNATGKTKMGTTGTGYSTGSNAGENAGNTKPGTNAGNRTPTTTREQTGKGKTRRDTIR